MLLVLLGEIDVTGFGGEAHEAGAARYQGPINEGLLKKIADAGADSVRLSCGRVLMNFRCTTIFRVGNGCGVEMQLNEREASLVDAFRRLPPSSAMELSALAERLAELTPNGRIDWSDAWSDEDLNDFRAASLRRLEDEESEGRN
jgi:hypothetical protein